MGKDAFLKLLITQLKFQDPMNPMEDRDFVTQLAQFSSLEQLEKLGNGFENLGQGEIASQAVSLIGKKIEYIDPEVENPIEGTVSAVKFEDGAPLLVVGDKKIMPAQVITVK
jgi:flagellar basal-body rod modification protein FlgD